MAEPGIRIDGGYSIRASRICGGPAEPAVHRPTDSIEDGIANAAQIEAGFPNPERGHPSTPPTNPNADRYRSGDAGGGGISESMPDQVTDQTDTNDIEPKTENPTGTKDIEPKAENPNCQTRTKLESGEGFVENPRIHPTERVELRDPSAERAAANHPQDDGDDDEIYYHVSGDLSAEDLEGNLAVLPEIPILTTAKVSIEDLLVGDSRSATPEEIKKLRQIIWKEQHLLIGKGNALTPAARASCLIKGLLAADIIRPSTSPWVSPILIVRKNNGVDIGLCIDYKLVNSLTSGFWVVPMTDRSRKISAFITPSYIGNIMIAVETWDQMCQMVEDLMEACLEANPKDLKSVTDLPFPGSFRSMQSFLGSLNYYIRFIEGYAIYASVLYELREVEFVELEKRSDLRKIMDQDDPIARDNGPPELQLAEPLDEWWIRVHMTFLILKNKIATTPIHHRLDEARTPVVIVYAGDWAISASLTQEHDGIYHPVVFASRTLKTNELNYNMTEKEVLALLRILDLYYNLLMGREIRCTKGEDEILGTIAATITPRLKMDDALTAIAPRKEPKRRIQTPIPTVDREEEFWVVSFDGSARVKRGGVAFSAIVWSLPGWEVVKARSGYLESLTVNEAEYNGLLLRLEMLGDLDRLTLLKRNTLDRMRKWSDHELVHVTRAWNGSADSLASANLQRQGGIEVQGKPECRDLVTLNRLDEILIPKTEIPVDLIREMRVDRLRQAQEEEAWITGIRKYLGGLIVDLTQAEARSYGTIAADYEVDEQDLHFYCAPMPR
ncbi:reverse transcriptase [Phytophthora megakarya]|uniref:Reverse transcriptase n=1 Tax=Phytophthora megakarya TaxID=4795 RepID=A0A225V8A7_9STRA|nr:reverse transcriptase [Phytophthora megakarya]